MHLFQDRQPLRDVIRSVGALPTAPQAALFHLNAKFTRNPNRFPLLDDQEAPRPVLDGLDREPLPPPGARLDASLREAILARRSVRRFRPDELGTEDLATLLGYGAGVTTSEGERPARRSVPSGGAKYPVYVMASLRRPRDKPLGVYGYDPVAHALVPYRLGERAVADIDEACLVPWVVENATLVLLLVGILPRSTRKYGDHGYRLALQETGHVAQNICLLAAVLGLGSVVLADFDEPEVEGALGINGESETLLSTIVVGTPAESEPEDQRSP